MQGFHGAGDRGSDNKEGDDLECLDAIDSQRSARRKEIQVDQEQRDSRGDCARAGSAVPGRDGDSGHEKQEARCGTVAPQDKGSNKRDRGDQERQNVSREECLNVC